MDQKRRLPATANWYDNSMTGSQKLPPEGQDVQRYPSGDGRTIVMPEVRRRLLGHTLEGWPEEVCGLLLGRGDTVEDVTQLRNCSPRPRDHYALDPLEYMHAEREWDQRGVSVLGVWHSHPDSAGVPSVTDERHAWPGWLYVIVGRPRDQVPDVRGWRLENGRFRRALLHFERQD